MTFSVSTALAVQGYERTAIDIVPVRAKTARATVYRRWATKADLVTWIIDVANAGRASAGQHGSLVSFRGQPVLLNGLAAAR